MMAHKSLKEDYVAKLLILGDSGVGKSSLLLRYCDDTFTSSFIATIGIDFKIKRIDVDGKQMKLLIWDTAGQERFRTITRAYYRGAQAMMLVYDVTDETTFQNVRNWMKSIDQNTVDGEGIPKILLGNKSDLKDQRVVSKSRGEALAEEYGIPFLETSARQKANVSEAFNSLALGVKKIVDSRVKIVTPSKIVRIEDTGKRDTKYSACGK